jgi:hypothetical protein
MSDAAAWQQSNSRQLSTAVENLRLRLEAFVQRSAQPRRPASSSDRPAPSDRPETGPVVENREPEQAPETPRAKTVSRSFIEKLLRKSSGPATPAPPPPAADSSTAASAATVPAPAGAVEEAKTAVEPPSALDALGERLGLSAFERNVLLLCVAMELDTRIAGLCARAQDDPCKSFPTFSLALALFDDPSWDVLSPGGPLRYWRLIEINQSGSQPLTASALRADERIVNYVKGLNYIDERLFSLLVPLDLEAGPAGLARSQAQVVEAVLHRWKVGSESGLFPIVQLLGPDPLSKQLVACAAAAEFNRRLYRLPAELLPAAPSDLEILARLWQRESRLMPVALYLDAEELERRATEPSGPLGRFLARGDSVIFLGVSEVLPRICRNPIILDVAKPSAVEQQAAWAETLGDEANGSPPMLAAQFNLNLATIQNLTRTTRAEIKGVPTSLAGKIWDVCCDRERPRLDALAQRLQPKATWDDLVLPAAPMNLLKQIAAQVAYRNVVYEEWGFARKMNRGFSVSALFAGDSGTGKTMAAEVIAQALRLNLYRIDLAGVVDKYIGETEKNLRRLFDAAEDGGAILFFDEADALFGKRSEVKDSHDRYANIEINYLLQRIESYRGLAILATNMKTALDTAFLRRLRFVVDFPFPGTADRRRVWERVFLQPEPAGPPLGELDYDRLARLNLSPGHIHTVALNAAFMAAHENSNVTMQFILEAARAEFMKLGRPINEADFRWNPPALPAPQTTNGQHALA